MASAARFYYITKAQYDQQPIKDQYGIYFLSDTKQIIRGEEEFAKDIEIVTELPLDPMLARTNVLYVNSVNQSLLIFDGTQFITIIKPTTTGFDDGATDDVIPTAKAVAEYTNEKLSAFNTDIGVTDITYADKQITVTNYGEENPVVTKLSGLFDGASYDGSTGVFTFTTNGGEPITVNIDKENFLSDAVRKAVTAEDLSGEDAAIYDGCVDGDIGILLTMESGTKIFVKLTEFIDVYTGKNSATVNMTVSGYEISADVNVSADAGNKLEAKANGLFVAETPVVTFTENGLMSYGQAIQLNELAIGIKSMSLYITGSSGATVGTLSHSHPSDTGTVVPAWGGSLTNVERQLFGFQLTTEQNSVILPNNVYNVILPLSNLSANRSYKLRAILTVQHPTLNGGAELTIVDDYIATFEPVSEEMKLLAQFANQHPDPVSYPAGSIINIELWGSVLSSTGTLSLLVNDSNNVAVLSRNDYSSNVSANDVMTNSTGGLITQEAFNIQTMATINGILFEDNDPIDAYQAYDELLGPYTWLDSIMTTVIFRKLQINMKKVTFMAVSDNGEATGDIVINKLVNEISQGTIVIPITTTPTMITIDINISYGMLRLVRENDDELDTLAGAVKIWAISTWRSH
jgi:hypothetical protein